jgi:NAD-specific glutamate dehydrogenase
MFPACEVVAVADDVGIGVGEAAAIYFALDASLRLGHLRDLLQRTTPKTPWERLALEGLYDDIVEEQRRLTIQALTRGQIAGRVAQLAPIEAEGEPRGAEQLVEAWLTDEVAGFSRWQQVLGELDSQSGADLAMLSVVVRSLHGLDSRKAA